MIRPLPSLTLRRSPLSAAAFLVVALVACERHSDSADAGATAPAASSAPPASAVTLAPLTDTASASAAPTATTPPLATEAKPATTATAKPATSATPSASASAKAATPSAQAQLKQCCTAIRKQAQRDPAQAAQLNQAATLCDGLVTAVAGAPNMPMPQLDGVKAMLGGAQLPPVCAGL